MTIIEFLAMEFDQFASFTKPQYIKLNTPGLHYVEGINKLEMQSNGAGKSTIWKALCWCLFGRTVDDLRNPDIVPWYGEQHPWVMITCRINGKVHKIARHVAPNKILINGKKSGQEHIDALIGIPIEVFTHTVLLGQEQPLFFDLKPQEKMQMFVDVLQLDRWDRYSKYSGTLADQFESELQDLTRDLEHAKGELKHLQETRKALQAQSDEWGKARANKIEDVALDLKVLLKNQRHQQDALDYTKFEWDAAATEIGPLREQLNTKETQHAMWQSEAENVNAQLEELKKKTHCPTCGQPIPERAVKKVRDDLLDRRDDLINKLTNKKHVQNVKYLRGQLTKLEARAMDAQSKFGRLSESVGQLNQKVRDLQARQEEQREQVNPFRGQLEALRKQQGHVEEDIRDAESACKGRERELAQAQFWVKGFKDIRLYVIEEVLQALQHMTNAMLPEADLSGWEVKLAIEKETKSGTVKRGINVEIASPDSRGVVKWGSWSGGEKQRMRIVSAQALAATLLAHAGVQVNLEILDEPTRGVDALGINDLIGYLSDRAMTTKSAIFFTDHHVVKSSRFTGTLTVIKTAKGSRITDAF